MAHIPSTRSALTHAALVCCQVGFGEDVNLLLSDRSVGLWTAFEGVGRHVAFFMDNVPL
jgi:hypothetical protein